MASMTSVYVAFFEIAKTSLIFGISKFPEFKVKVTVSLQKFPHLPQY